MLITYQMGHFARASNNMVNMKEGGRDGNVCTGIKRKCRSKTSGCIQQTWIFGL